MDQEVKDVRRTTRGQPFDSQCLGRQVTLVTYAFLFTDTTQQIVGGKLEKRESVHLKLGRYHLQSDGGPDFHNPESMKPKSEVVLTPPQTRLMAQFFSEKYPLLESGASRYVEVETDAQADAIGRFKALVEKKNVPELLEFIEEHQLINDDLHRAISARDRVKALDQFKEMLEKDLPEVPDWQDWFSRNDWVLGTDFVMTLDERRIDKHNTADYLAKAHDGHLDIVEIKRPRLSFWATHKDHDNLVPHSDLVKAIVQGQNYAFELEREMGTAKAKEDYGVPIAKPRVFLIYGRSNTWGEEELRAQRLLNGGLSGLQILTYDQILAKAERSTMAGSAPWAAEALEEFDPFAE